MTRTADPHNKAGVTGRGPEARSAVRDDVRPLAAMLARPFEDDPVANYLMPSARRRPGGLRTFFEVQMAGDLLAHGGVFTTADRSGAALWAPPDKPPLPLIRALRNALPTAPYVIGRNFLRSIRFLAHVEAIHPKEPHWYLATLGTE